MYKKRIFLIITALLIVMNTQAQLQKAIQQIFEKDSIVASSTTINQDSEKVEKIRKELEEARLSEANMQLQIEQMKLKYDSSDSTKYAAQKAKIDSLRNITHGAPVIVDGDTLFTIYAKKGGYSAKARAEQDATIITKLGKKFNLSTDSIYIENGDIITDIMYENTVIASFTDEDGMWAGCSRQQLAQHVSKIIVAKLNDMHKEYGLTQLVKQILFFIIIITVQYVLIRLTVFGYRKLKLRIKGMKDTRLKSIKIQNFDLLDAQKQVMILIMLANIAKYIIILLQFLISIPLMFSAFPQTKPFAYKILFYVWQPVKSIMKAVIEYIPNLFTIIVIFYAIKYLIRILEYLTNELAEGKIKFNNFYPDWAIPTFHIVRFLLYAFMVAMIYPYLPGSNSGVFQGISVFVGLIISLGSSSVISNIIAGMVITYMRPFKLGDRIKLNDTIGNVIEKTALVTRIRTPKNELVTIPNSFIMSSHTTNYSESARTYGLIIHSEVSIGYDAPWRQVNDLLINAALATPGVEPEPKPFVLETSLSDFYPVYQINAYIKEADKMAQIYTDLHQNIQDFFDKAGVEILSPHYIATRDGNESTIPKNPGYTTKS